MENQLPDIVIVNLFKDKLVLLDEKQPESRREIPTSEGTQNNESDNMLPEIWWLGKNKKNITILLKDISNKFISENNLSFLLSILNACKLTPDDIAVVNLANTKVKFEKINNTLQPEVVLLFDTKPAEIEIDAKPLLYTVMYPQGFKLLYAASLDNLNGNAPEQKVEKGKLWNALKLMFDI